jgi:hypothetical protein
MVVRYTQTPPPPTSKIKSALRAYLDQLRHGLRPVIAGWQTVLKTASRQERHLRRTGWIALPQEAARSLKLPALGATQSRGRSGRRSCPSPCTASPTSASTATAATSSIGVAFFAAYLGLFSQGTYGTRHIATAEAWHRQQKTLLQKFTNNLNTELYCETSHCGA